jgi:integrase
MPKKAKELSAVEVQRLTTPGLHFVGGVAGLALQVLPTGGRSWVLRTKVGTKRRDMGLGGFPDVTLAKARTDARAARDTIRGGTDPIEEARAKRSALKAAQAAALTFEQCAAEYIKAQRSGWRNDKHAQQWENTLSTYAYPHLGSILVQDIGLPNVLAVLKPIWETKTETASRVRGRIESVLSWATAHGYRHGLNPARWRGHLDQVLPKPSKVATVENREALKVSEMGAFMLKLRVMDGAGAKALEFAILTAARSGEVRGATWDEIDTTAKVWVIPASRMKAGKEHRVPLSDEAVRILSALPHSAGSPYVFTAPRGGQLSDMTLSAVTRRMGAACVPHGFRSTFRDWVSERTSYPGDMAEMALAHTISSKVEAAYRRGDMIDKRRQMMSDWAGFCAVVETTGAVIPMTRRETRRLTDSGRQAGPGSVSALASP